MTRRLLLAAPALSALPAAAPLTIGEALARIRKETGVAWREQTVDTLKTGSPDTPLTGIATTFMATHAVLEKAAAKRLNLVITHEPTFYNHQDETKNFAGDAVYEAKRTLIDQNKMGVFRFHDHWHMMRPDGIRTGMEEALGWSAYARGGHYDLPRTTLGELTSAIRRKLRVKTMRVIGDPALPVSRVAMMPGAGGSAQQEKLLSTEGIDALVIGETREWETVEYARDAILQGRKKALIILGHAPSEEGGMEYCARWLKTFLKETPVEFVAAGEPFWAPR
jgi:putative NIF3 family GTP cyclohydrolase 1 type 2